MVVFYNESTKPPDSTELRTKTWMENDVTRRYANMEVIHAIHVTRRHHVNGLDISENQKVKIEKDQTMVIKTEESGN